MLDLQISKTFTRNCNTIIFSVALCFQLMRFCDSLLEYGLYPNQSAQCLALSQDEGAMWLGALKQARTASRTQSG